MADRVNDIHAQLNETIVADVIPVDSIDAIRQAIGRSQLEGLPIAVCGGRHAMGGQQFCSGGLLLDTRPLGRVLELDRERGTIDVEAGIQWPALLAYLDAEQDDGAPAWGIRQKQTGADRLSLGGALAANVHGRGLAMKPIVDDVESVTLVDGAGEVACCSRDRERRAVPPRDRWLRPVRRRLLRDGFGSRRGGCSSASSRSGRSTALIDAFDGRIDERLPLRRLPVRDRP